MNSQLVAEQQEEESRHFVIRLHAYVDASGEEIAKDVTEGWYADAFLPGFEGATFATAAEAQAYISAHYVGADPLGNNARFVVVEQVQGA